MKRIYLDYAATTPVDPRVAKAMEPFWNENFGNAGGLYEEGRRAKEALTKSRETITKLIGAKPDEIIFTSGGTESDNLAVFGVANAALQVVARAVVSPSSKSDFGTPKKSDFFPGDLVVGQPSGVKPHIIITKFEHHAVLTPCEQLAKEDFDVTFLDVGENGIVDPEDVRKALRPETVLVSIMYANNEIGTIQPIAEVGKVVKDFRMAKEQILKDLASPTGVSTRNFSAEKYPCLSKFDTETFGKQYPYFHTDACQAAGYLDLNVNNLGVDLMTVNASKIYGPKGVGFLYKRSGVKIKPQIIGGGQEMRMRSGTENIPLIVGLAKAFELAQAEKDSETARLVPLRDYFISEVMKRIPKVVLNGHTTKRLPNNINVSILDIEGEALVLYLDSKGISFSTGSACTSESLDPSHVILALGKPYEFAHSSMRFTLGRSTTKTDIDYVMGELPKTVEWLRIVSPISVDMNASGMSHPEAFAGENLRVKAKSKSYKPDVLLK
ncbi:MAG: cysteine desulfurase family protein [bacterium]|nr:cysteine desulfurase family protein [bacterium]